MTAAPERLLPNNGRRLTAWAVCAAATRLPNAMAPLALVFLGHGAAGRYSTGSILAACYILGEVLGAAFIGTRVPAWRERAYLATGLVAGAAGFALLMTPGAGLALLVIGSVLAGGAPAVSPGIMRSLLSALVPEARVARAFSLDNALSELAWLAAPALVGVLAVQAGEGVPIALCAVSLPIAALAALVIGNVGEKAGQAGGEAGMGRPPARVVATGWPAYLTSAAAMSLSAVCELMLPALLVFRGEPAGYAGWLLAGLAGASLLASLGYGTRTWRGGTRLQGTLALAGTTVAVAAVALAPTFALLGVALVAVGAFQAIVMITRNLRLREVLPAPALTAGYSVMYAIQGIGYSVSALAASVVLDHGGPRLAILGGVALTVVLGASAVLGDRDSHQPVVPEPATRPGVQNASHD